MHNRFSKFVAAAATATIAAAMIAVGAPSASAATSITVSGGFAGFTPKTIHVKAGEATTITYKNIDATLHDFTVSDMGFKVEAEANASGSKVLTATAAQVGSHKFICSVPGHAGAMNGTLIVDPAAGGGGGAPATTAPAATDAPSASAPAQVNPAPSGGVQTGGGSTAGFAHSGLVTLGGGLLLAAFMSAMLGWRVARRD